MSNIVLILDEAPVSPAREAEWLAELPPERRAKLHGWDAAARGQSLLGSRLLREGLRRLGHPASALSGLRYGTSGRPTLDVPVQFSIAHCEGRVLCALSADGPVGIDVEPLSGLGADAFQRYLTLRERSWAGSDPHRFLVLWTRKEAVAKAAGTLGLRDLPAIDAAGECCMLNGEAWWTAPVDAGAGFVAHVAGTGAPPAPRVDRIDATTLV